MSRVGLHIIVTGRVQGVGYRYFARKTAEAFDIDGTVRNRHDGSVELHACGEEENMRGFVEQLELGPSGSFVDRVETFDEPIASFPSGFHIEQE